MEADLFVQAGIQGIASEDCCEPHADINEELSNEAHGTMASVMRLTSHRPPLHPWFTASADVCFAVHDRRRGDVIPTQEA
jgi:hypothetical protein